MPATSPLLTATILSGATFLLGVILVNQIVDYNLLYATVVPEGSVERAWDYYKIWFDAPAGIKAVLHASAIIPIIAVVFKLNTWTESAIFFDGCSLVLEVATVVLYLSVTIPSARIFLPYVAPKEGSWQFLPQSPPEPDAVPATYLEKEDAVKVLGAANALIALCLIGVVIMQAGQEYARRTEEAEQKVLDAAYEAKNAAVAAETKKDI